MLVIADKLVAKDDTLYLYYCGQGEEWTGWPASNEPAAFRYDSAGAVRLSRMGLATLRRDGFVGLETTDRETPGTPDDRSYGRRGAGSGAHRQRECDSAAPQLGRGRSAGRSEQRAAARLWPRGLSSH